MAHIANQGGVIVRSIKGNLVCGEMALDEMMGWEVMLESCQRGRIP